MSTHSAKPRGRGEGTRFGVIEQTVVIGASPREVYQAYVDPEKHAAFTGFGATGTPKVGGRFTAGDGYISGKYIELKPGTRIKHEWITTEWPAGYPPSILELTMKPRGKGTELTMVHSKVPAEQVEYYAKGWKEHYWRPLRKYFETGRRPKK
ncbi:MAG TPA: SRPBCC domain-containing protein [Nitrososphaerales archaeon]|nr:SRPBCC domain-containing protein [Nitrososphaerales archaeon]